MTGNISDEKMCEWYTRNISTFSRKIWLPTKLDCPYNIKYKGEFGKINFECMTDKKVPHISFEYKFKENNELERKFKSYKKARETIKKSDDTEKTKKNKLRKASNCLYKVLEKQLNVIKTKRYKINLTDKQSSIIQGWMDECTRIYNYCVTMYNSDSDGFERDYQKLKIIIFNKLYGDGKKPCTYDILTDEVRVFCSNLKSCESNLENGNIKFFIMKYRNTYKSQTILIPKKSINTNGIFTTILGKLNNKLTFDHNKISDSRLLYDKRKKKYYLLVPTLCEKQKINIPNETVASIDPGEKIPFTIYSLNHCSKIGENIRIPILKYQGKIRQTQKIIDKNVNKNGNKIRNKHHLRKRINKFYCKIKNMVKELHNKTAIYLCKNYKFIILPEFETSKMLGKYSKKNTKKIEDKKEKAKQNKLNKRVKFVLQMLSHYKFKQHIIEKCNEYGCQLIIANESYTTMTCSSCGWMSKKCTIRIKQCTKCNFRINRDINGSRNIFLKNHNHFIKAIR